MAAGIVDQNRTSVKLAHILAMAKHRSKLEGVLPGEVKRARCPFFNPFKAIGAARFLAEVIAHVPGRSQHHFGRSLCRYAATHNPVRQRALQ